MRFLPLTLTLVRESSDLARGKVAKIFLPRFEVRIELQRLFEVSDRFRLPAKLHERYATLVIEFGSIRSKTNGCVEGNKRIARPPQPFQHQTLIEIIDTGCETRNKRLIGRQQRFIVVVQ